MTYVVSIYQLGFLAHGEPYETESLSDALSVLKSEIRNTIDSIADDSEFLAADTALRVADIDTKARDALNAGYPYYYDVAGYRHALEIFPY